MIDRAHGSKKTKHTKVVRVPAGDQDVQKEWLR